MNRKVTKEETSQEVRRRYAEGKLTREARRPSAAHQECERLLVYLRRLAAKEPGATTLDLGCGTGGLTVELATRGFDMYATDINIDFTEITQAKAKDRGATVQAVVAAAEELPFRNGTFDICIINNVLEHVVDWKTTIKEVARVIKPGGIAYFDAANRLYPLPNEVRYFPFFSYIPGKIRQHIMNIIVAHFPHLVDYSPTPARNWSTPTGLRKALARAGFTQSWDIFDIITEEEIPSKYRFARHLLPLIQKIPTLYVRDIAHFPLTGVRIFCRRAE
jgi:ubiquinone/menaquinone biosynthesis C-methylase UbiE